MMCRNSTFSFIVHEKLKGKLNVRLLDWLFECKYANVQVSVKDSQYVCNVLDKAEDVQRSEVRGHHPYGLKEETFSESICICVQFLDMNTVAGRESMPVSNAFCGSGGSFSKLNLKK